MRRSLARELASFVDELAFELTWEALYMLLSFAKLVLRNASRGGKQHPNQLVNDVSRRLKMWQEAQYDPVVAGSHHQSANPEARRAN